MVAEVVTACVGGAMITAWGLHLQCSPALIGVLSSLSFMSQFIQFPAAWLTSTFGHRRICIAIVALSRFWLLALALMPLLPLSLHGRQLALVTVSAVYALLSVAGNNAWVAWMGDLVPPAIRGRYFGRRTALCTLGGTLASIAAGFALDRARAANFELYGLAALALVAVLCGVVCLHLMLQQHDPGYERSSAFDLAAALKPFRDRAARGLLGYQVFWNFGLGLAAGYFSLHSVQNLKMGFLLIAVQTAAMSAVRIIAAPIWGRVVDRVGARAVLITCSYGMACIPLIWLFPRADNLWPLLFDVVWTGAVWSGHSVASFNLPLAVAPRRERAYYLAAFSTAGGLVYAGASAIGGMLLTTLPHEFTLAGLSFVNVHVVFVASSLLRLGAATVGARILKPEARGSRANLREAVVDEVGEFGARVASLPVQAVAVARRITNPEQRAVRDQRSA